MSTIYQTKSAIIDACNRVLSGAPKEYPPDLPTSKELMGASDWYPFENTAWSIGENIRLSLAKNRKLITDDEILRHILQVVKCVNLRRGRESFVMALAFKGAAKVAGEFATFLDDTDIDGHVVDTLLKMKVGGFRNQVQHLHSSNRAWIRKLSKRYVARYP